MADFALVMNAMDLIHARCVGSANILSCTEFPLVALFKSAGLLLPRRDASPQRVAHGSSFQAQPGAMPPGRQQMFQQARRSICSARHVPGYLEQFDALTEAGIDEIWCVSVNDAYVMGAWARDQQTSGKIRMLADGTADFVKAMGLTLDLTSGGLGLRSARFSMLVKDGAVASLNVEDAGKFDVSDASTMLAQVRG